jgi:hypothetical protein
LSKVAGVASRQRTTRWAIRGAPTDFILYSFLYRWLRQPTLPGHSTVMTGVPTLEVVPVNVEINIGTSLTVQIMRLELHVFRPIEY